MYRFQIKTLELSVIRELGRSDADENIKNAFAYAYNHFTDENYLYGIEHKLVIDTIYNNNFYKYKSTKALSQETHIDTKTLLTYRKSYLRLLAKQYLNLNEPTALDLTMLYNALEKLAESRGETCRKTE